MKKNILLVANYDSNVGYAWWLMENFWAHIAEEFTRKGHRCFLIYPSISVIPKIIEDAKIQLVKHDYADTSIRSLTRMLSFIRSNDVAHIYLTDKPETSILYILFKLYGAKTVVIHVHTPGERTKVTGIKLFIKKLYKRMPLLNADVFIAVTDYVRDRMIQCSALPPRKCFVAKNGILPIGRSEKYRYYCHDEFNLPYDSIIIITTGRAHFYKNIGFMIEAFAKILSDDSFPNLYFIYCGEGPHLSNFQALAAELRVKDKFIFAGKRSDINLLLQSCDIGVQASKGEVGYSLSILEYMSAGLATLVPDNPSVCQSINDGCNGLYYKNGELSSLCDKLVYLIYNKKLRESLGANAILTIEKDFHLKNTNNSLIDILTRYFG